MKIIRFLHQGEIGRGRLNPDGTASRFASPQDGPLSLDTPWNFLDEKIVFDSLLAPLIPTDILAIGLNYHAHAQEGKAEIPSIPLLFIKAGNSLNHPNAVIPLPRLSEQIDYEGELAVIIGKTAKDVPKEKALDYVLGYTCANDVTARDWQRDKKLGGGQFARGKSFDGFCPLGPWMVTRDTISNPNDLRLQTYVNDQLMQDQNTSDMIFDVPTLIESLSSTMTLRPGTILLTGTPSGVGFARNPPVWLRSGDQVRIEISGIGVLENSVV